MAGPLEASVASGLSWEPLIWGLSYNEAEPNFASWGDGAEWQGAGLNSSLQGGFRWAGGFWDLAVDPVVWYSQNQAFEIPTDTPINMHPPYGGPYWGVWDHPLRFGDQPITHFDPGQTRLKVFLGPWFLSLGTANRTWGPSRYNGILLSSNGPGVPSVELGLDPWSGDWGVLETHLIYGMLRASGYQLDNGMGGTRLWSALFLGYTPPFAPNLTLGVGRTANSYWSQMTPQDFLLPFTFKATWGTDKYDQRMSLMYRYRVPSAGLEFYGEWARNDFSPGLNQYISDLEHQQAYVLGVRKSLDRTPWGQFSLEGELGVLALGTEQVLNLFGYYPLQGQDFYTHGIVTEGYSIEGQDLGAAAGNGNFQLVRAEWTFQSWSTTLRFIRWVKDYSLVVALGPGNESRIDVSLDSDLEIQHRWDSWVGSIEVGTNQEYDRMFRYNWSSYRISAQVAYQF